MQHAFKSKLGSGVLLIGTLMTGLSLFSAPALAQVDLKGKLSIRGGLTQITPIVNKR
jgi:hypothetical protein